MSKPDITRKAPVRPPLSLDKAATLVARGLGMSQEELAQAFRPATMADLPQILALRRAVLTDDLVWDDAAYLSWRYKLGRPGEGAGECWVLTRGDELIGMIGTEDLTLTVAGVSVDGIRVMDILVQPHMLGKGLGPWFGLTMQSKTRFAMAVGANTNSKRMIERTFEVLPNRRIFIHPIGLGQFVLKRLKWAPLAGAVSTLADWGLVVARACLLGYGLSGIKVKKLDRLPDELPALLSRSVRSDRVEVLRSAASLSWRFGTPRARFDIWGAWHQGVLVGLMVTRPDVLANGRQSWMIMDVILQEDMKPAVLRALLRLVVGEARGQNVGYLSIVSYRKDIEHLLSRVGFIERSWAHRAIAWLRSQDAQIAANTEANNANLMAWSCTDDVLRAHVTAGADWSFNELHCDGG
ncbi:MAG: GNAT family N-acetyltransferase [Aquabacterium sp.]|nr:GNAT family N-acetyltransferase [Aquabacterium sp.]